MNYLKLSFVLFLLISVLSSCNRDDEIETKNENYELETRSSSYNLNCSEFEEEFYRVKSLPNEDCITPLDPIYYELDVSSATCADYFGTPAVIYNVLSSPFEYTELFRNQVLIQKNSESDFEISTLLYCADSSFYAEKAYAPLLPNFTGDIIEYSSIGVTSIYNFLDGNIILVDEDVEVQAKPKIKCPKFGDGGFFRRFGRWVKKITRGGGSGSGNSGGSGGNGSPGGGFSGGATGFGGYFIGGRGLGGSGGGGCCSGGGGTSYGPICENSNIFWAQYDFMTKKNYLEALSFVLGELNIAACYDPFATEEPCQITYPEILCAADDSGCFGDGSSIVSEQEFVDCLTEILAPEGGPIVELPCQIAVETFNINYGTNFTPQDLYILLGGFGAICGNQDDFDEAILKHFYNNPEDDPDLIIDCASFDFVEVSGGDYQACGVNNMSLYFYFYCPFSVGIKYGYYTGVTIKTIFFEFPAKRANGAIITKGQAQSLSAQAVKWAEEQMEVIYGNSCPPYNSTLILTQFKDFINSWVTTYGGRATLIDNYGPVPIKNASYLNYGTGPCN